MKNKISIKEYYLIVFSLCVIFSRIYYLVSHYISNRNIFILTVDVVILIFDVTILLELIGKAVLVRYVLMLASLIIQIILNKYIYSLTIIMNGLLCIILIGEYFYSRKKTK